LAKHILQVAERYWGRLSQQQVAGRLKRAGAGNSVLGDPQTQAHETVTLCVCAKNILRNECCGVWNLRSHAPFYVDGSIEVVYINNGARTGVCFWVMDLQGPINRMVLGRETISVND
jgi:hypothetical protein